MQTFKLLPHDTVMLLQPVLVKNFGKSGALLLSQLHYWLTKKDSLGCDHQGNRWIYNTAEEWAEQLQLSARYIRHLFAELANLGIVKVKKLHKIKSVRTNYYSIDYDRLNDFIGTPNVEDSDIHAEKITGPLGTNNLMYNDTKTTIKDFNKSEEFEKNPDGVGQGDSSSTYAKASVDKQVEQVKNLNLKNEKSLETKISIPTSEIAALQDTAGQTKSSTLAIKTSTAQDMLKIWNENFSNKAEIKLSKDLAPMLVAAFKTKFATDLANWQNYCEQLKSSEYLMADSFKLTIGWALKFGTIDRIRAGDLGVKLTQAPVPTHETIKRQDERIDQAIEALPETSIFKALRRQIVKEIGAAHYFSWFHEAKFCEQDGKICMVAPNAFTQNWWETHYDKIIKLAAMVLKPVTLDQLNTEKLDPVGQGVENITALESDNPICQMIEAKLESVAAKDLRHKLVKAVGAGSYLSWFHEASFCEQEGNIRMIAPNDFVGQYWETHFDWVMRGS